MNTVIIVFSQKGYALGKHLVSYFEQKGDRSELTYCETGKLTEWTGAHFHYDALIFIGSCGIAVRAIAPFLTSKTCDPAVVVIDELGTYAISLLSGHIGGANDIALKLAQFLDAIPVVTTATDVHNIFAIDTWAVKQGLKIANPERIKGVSARLLAGATISIQTSFPVIGPLPSGITLCNQDGDVLITYTCGHEESLRLIPSIITLGIGCKKNVAAETIARAFALTLKKANCHRLAITQVCSIEQKAREPGILEFCQAYGLPYKTFSPQELRTVPGTYASSAFVKEVTGVDNVCERSAVLGSGAGGRLLAEKDALNGVTMALAISPYNICFDEV